MIYRALVFILILVIATSARSEDARSEEIPPPLLTCYELIGKNEEAPSVKESLTVLIDQTVGFQPREITEITQHVTSWMTSGREVFIYSFSSNSGNENVIRVYAVRVNPEADEDWKNWLKKSQRQRFEACEREQPEEARKRVKFTVGSILNGSSTSIPRSEILNSLQLVSEGIKMGAAKRKVVFIASDMLENSSMISFYQNRKLRKINPESIMRDVEKNKLLANFGGAEIYIYGIAYLPSSPKVTRVGPDLTRPLVEFWKNYFVRSNSSPHEFGQPALLGEVK